MKACLVLAVAALTGPVAVASDYVPGEVIVAFPITTALTAINDMAAANGGVVKSATTVPGQRIALVAFPPESGTVEEVVAALSATPGIAYAEPNYVVRNTSPVRPSRPHPADFLRIRTGLDDQGRPTYRNVPTPTTYYSRVFPADDHGLNQWGWCDIGASVVWRLGRASMPVALLDTGVDYTHPDLLRRVIRGHDWVNNDNNPMDDNGSGTHMAGIIVALANNRKGITGLANTSVVAIKMLDADGVGTHYNATLALREAFNRRSRIIVIGWSGPDEGMTVRNALKRLVAGGRLIVAAAGDSGTDVPQYPAAYSSWLEPDQPETFNKGILSVAAAGAWVTPSGGGDDVFVEYARAPYSNYGTWVNITAPGTDITSTTPNNKPFAGLDAGDAPDGYNVYSGTAVAAAEAAGALSKVWGIFRAAPIHVFHRVTAQAWPGLPAYTGPVDVDGDGVAELEAAWDPISSGPSVERPYFLVNFNMAHALARSAAWGRFWDASTGEPLVEGYGRLLSAYHCPKKRNFASGIIGRDGNADNPEFFILQIPWDTCEVGFRVNRRGYTNGSIDYGLRIVVDGHQNPRRIYYEAEDLAVPPTGAATFVANWGDGTDRPIDLDLHVLQPSSNGEVCDVGPAPPLALDPDTFCGAGSPNSGPFARLLVESTEIGHNFEAVKTTLGAHRYVTEAGVPPYTSFVVSRETNLPTSGFLVARLWVGGAIKRKARVGMGTVMQAEPLCSIFGGEADCKIWLPLTLEINANRRLIYNVVNEFGDGVNVAKLPF